MVWEPFSTLKWGKCWESFISLEFFHFAPWQNVFVSIQLVWWFVKDGSFSFPSFGRSSLGSWICFVIDRTFPLFLPTSQASWLWLQTWVPVRVSLPPSGGWIPGPSKLFAKNFLFSRQWSSFAWGPPPGSPVLFLLVRLHRLFYQDALDPFLD